MIKEAWDEAGIKPSRPATDEEFMRRVYLDVIGRTPNLQEAQAFLGSKEKGKSEKLVEYLLNHPDYARNFGTQWTVLLLGRKRQERQVDRDALATWMRRQFIDNRPWDKVVYDLVTAKGNNKENGAVNFSLAHMEGGSVPVDLGDDPAVRRPADPVYPVPRPPVERLEAGRLLGDERLL